MKLAFFIRKRVLPLVVILLGGLIFLGLFSGAAATNIVAESGLSDTLHTVTANQLKPAACTMTLTNIIIGTNGTQDNDLILGTAANDTGGSQLKGLGGDDCIIGGAGDDTLTGGKGNDVLLGGGGNDDLDGGQDDDYLDGGSGNDTCNIKHGTDTTNDCETITN